MPSVLAAKGSNLHHSGEIAALNGVTVQLPSQLAKSFNNIGDAGVFGVDLFFVLSGFLITSILLRRRTEPRYFRNFYARRFLRLFPLYYAYLVFAAFALPLFHRATHSTMSDYRGSWWWYVAYLSNWKPGHGAHDPFLGHFWSLAVEAQRARLRAATQQSNSPVFRVERLTPGPFCAGSSKSSSILSGRLSSCFYRAVDWPSPVSPSLPQPQVYDSG